MPAPSTKEGFSYDAQGFYVTVDGQRHGRHDSGPLYNLLTYVTPPPVLTKAGKVAKRQPAPSHTDPPGHFYVAQLLHYGLPPMKIKDPAKTCLLTAFGTQRELIVPKHILELEKSLKKQYSQANDLEVKNRKMQREQEEATRRKKQKRDEDVVLKEFINAGIIIGTGLLLPDSEDELEDEDSLAAVSNTQLHYGVTALPKDRLCEVLIDLMYRMPAVKKALVKELGTSSNLMVKASEERKIKTSDVVNDNAGEYKIIAPYLRDQWPDNTEQMVLKISLSQKGSHLWARFHFGIVSGIIRSCGPLPQKVGDVCRFLWRGREEGEGEQTFGDTNWGNITFLDDGRIKGVMQWMRAFEFVGKKVKGPDAKWVKNVISWKEEWRGINERSYEYARVARWGGGGYGDDEGSMSPNSDTDSELDNDDSDREENEGYADFDLELL